MTLPATTPAKKPFTLPSKALEQAIGREWENTPPSTKHQAPSPPALRPLTLLAFTAIDRIVPQQEAIIEALLVYADTDTLCYRAPEEELKQRQKAQWDVVVGWSSLLLGVKWEVVEGIMPLDQPPKLHVALRHYLAQKDAFVLAAFSVLAGGFSSLILAQAVVEKHLSAEQAFVLSCLEEEYSAEKWGRDAEADSRAKRIRKEMLEAGQFLKLLEES